MKPNKLLFPLAWVYDAITAVRNRMFDAGLLKRESFPIPVICVGNLNTGGTGKTPHIEYLISLLSEKKSLAVLSRGYKRTTRGMVEAGPGATSTQIGDEPYMIHRKFPGVVVAVAENRRLAVRRLMQSHPHLDIVLLDDGFQHRYVRPRLTILLTSYELPFTRDLVLPAGSLRESKSNYRHADVLVVTKCPDDITPAMRQTLRDEIRPIPGQLLLFSGMHYMPLVRAGGVPGDAGEPARCRVLAFSGLASPAGFVGYLSGRYPGFEHVAFGDHHRYSDEDIRRLVTKFNNIDADRKILVTTEKDFVKVNGHEAFAGLPLYYLPVRIAFDENDQKALEQKIESICST